MKGSPETPGRSLRARPPLRAAELEVEAANLELLVRVGRPLHVLLQPVVLVGLDDGQPREVLEEDLGHVSVRLTPDLRATGGRGGVAEPAELRPPPVILRAAGAEETPHHAIGVAERGRRVRPENALEALLAVLLGSHRVLDHLDLDVDADILP